MACYAWMLYFSHYFVIKSVVEIRPAECIAPDNMLFFNRKILFFLFLEENGAHLQCCVVIAK